MNKIDRLIGIIIALKENKKLTAKEISKIFEVSERTVYRDIDALSQLNVPIKAFEGFSGGYEIDENYYMPSLSLRENEVMYLLVCLKVGEIIRVPNMKADYESLKYKMLNILDEETKIQYMKLLERFRFNISSMVLSDYKQDITRTIIESFCKYKDLIIEYYNPKKDEFIERRITPHSIMYFSGGWYIDGYCHLREAKRSFRIDRIKNICISNETYTQIDVNKSIRSCLNNCVNVVIVMNKRLYETVKYDTIFLDAEVKTYSDDKVKLSFYTSDIEYIIKFAIRNFEDMSIIEPKCCIDRLRKTCEKILEKYKQL